MEYNSSVSNLLKKVIALITGGSGFVGKHLADYLSDCGDDVITTDISNGGPDLLDKNEIDE